MQWLWFKNSELLMCFIISPAFAEPLPGWVDNLNGPTGLMVAAAKGVIRSMLVDGKYLSEVIPVDLCINGLITTAFRSATEPKPERAPVYNMTAPDHKKISWGQCLDLGRKLGLEYPFEAGLWYPAGDITTNKVWHLINVVLFMWLPAYVIDFLLFLGGQKRFMVRVQNRISTGLEMLQFFTMRPWDFKSPNFQQTFKNLTPKDQKIFNVDSDKVDPEEYLKISILGGRQYVMKEPLTSLPKARKQLKALYVLDRVSKIVILGLLLNWMLGKFFLIFTDSKTVETLHS